jgi:hypothetical protein
MRTFILSASGILLYILVQAAVAMLRRAWRASKLTNPVLGGVPLPEVYDDKWGRSGRGEQFKNGAFQVSVYADKWHGEIHFDEGVEYVSTLVGKWPAYVEAVRQNVEARERTALIELARAALSKAS